MSFDRSTNESPAFVTAEDEEYQVVSSITKKVPPQEDKKGQSRVMDETMATAERVTQATSEIATSTLEASAAVTAHALHTQIRPKATEVEQDKVVQQAQQIGRSIGSTLSAAAAHIFTYVARNCGAHQCDACGKKNLYDYFTCSSSGCNDVDVCRGCYEEWSMAKAKWLSEGQKPQQEQHRIHALSHSFHYHDNSMFVIKSLAIGFIGLFVMRMLVKAVF